MPAIPVIDAHAHIDFSETTVPAEYDRYRRVMDDIDLRATLMMGGSVGYIEFFREQEALIELSQKHPEIYPIINFYPTIADESWLRALESWLENKLAWAVKLYPGYDPFYPSEDPWCLEVVSILERLDVPLVVHAGDVINEDGLLRYASPLPLDDLAVAHRSITIVMAHIGMPFIDPATAVLHKNPNVRADGSGLFFSPPGDYNEDDFIEELTERFRIHFPGPAPRRKIHYGGDFPFTDPAHHFEFWRRFLLRWDFTDEEIEGFFYENARTVFQLPLPEL